MDKPFFKPTLTIRICCACPIERYPVSLMRAFYANPRASDDWAVVQGLVL